MTPTASPLPVRRQILILAALFLLSLPLVTTRLYASDEVQYFAYLRSLWFDHDVAFDNEYRHFYDVGTVQYDGFRDTFLVNHTPTGLRESFATIGAALLWSPFYIATDVGIGIARMLGSPVAQDGYSKPYVAAVSYGSAFYAWLALLCGMAIARRVLLRGLPSPAAGSAHAQDAEAARARAERWRIERAIFAATVAIWLGTPLFFYMYIAPPMSHACSAFAVAAFVLVWLHVRDRWSLRGFVLLGALAALMGMTREQDVFIAIGPAIDWAVALVRRLRAGAPDPQLDPPGTPTARALVLHALAGAAACVLAYLPQLAAYTALNGYPGPTKLVARKMNMLAPHAFGVLFSTQHGMFFWTPLIVLAIAGLIWLARTGARTAAASPPCAARDRQLVALCVLALIASQVYIAGSVESWTVAGAFGQRRFVGLSSVLVFGLAAFFMALRGNWARRLGAAGAALAIWWNLALMAQFGAGLMDRQRLELGRNAYHAFVTIPGRVPDLAYRYIFARTSFYKPAAAPAPSGSGVTPPVKGGA